MHLTIRDPRSWLPVVAALVMTGCAPMQPTLPEWLGPVEIPGAIMDSTNRPVLPFSAGGSLFSPVFRAPRSRVTVLADGVPRSMRATAIAWIPMPPQGHDTMDALGRRVLEAWSEDERSEKLVASLPFSPGLVADREPRSSCCSRDDLRELRAEMQAMLDVAGEKGWHAQRGTLAISPPSITGRCSRALQGRIDDWGGYRATCYTATFEISMDLMFVQGGKPHAARAVRTRAIRRTSVKGIALVLDCARSRDDTAFCGAPPPIPE